MFPVCLALMAWIIISANGEEIDRRELSGALVVGRSPECDVAVRDLLLSRTHCKLEPVGAGWKVVDLNSRNGTRVGWQNVQTHVLRHGDHLRMGRTRIVFQTGEFEPAPIRPPRPNRIIRPADPHEALTGTVTEFVLLDEEASQEDGWIDAPYPQPRSLDPVAADTVGETLESEAASSFWCSSESPDGQGGTALMVQPRAIVRALPRLPNTAIYREIRRHNEAEAQFCLQADAALGPHDPPAPQRVRSKKFMLTLGVGLAAALSSAIVLMSVWLLTIAP